MKKLVMLLIVLALSVWGGLHMAAAQEGTDLKALSLGPVSVVTAPGEAEVVAELAEYTQVTVLRTDETGAWLEVETADELTGFAPVESFMILNLPPLAPKAYVATNRTGVTALYVEPNITAEFSTTLPDGTIGTILGTHGAEWAYVATGLGTGWSIVTDWEMLPEGAKPALVETVRVEQIGIYAEPNLTAEISTTIPNGTLLYWLAEPDGEFVEVLLPDASTGFALTTDFVDVPGATVVSETGRNGTAAIYAEANFEGEIVTTLEDGVACALLSAVGLLDRSLQSDLWQGLRAEEQFQQCLHRRHCPHAGCDHAWGAERQCLPRPRHTGLRLQGYRQGCGQGRRVDSGCGSFQRSRLAAQRRAGLDARLPVRGRGRQHGL
jgi:hypothetical protein